MAAFRRGQKWRPNSMYVRASNFRPIQNFSAKALRTTSATLHTLPRGGMYWKICPPPLPPRIGRFAEAGILHPKAQRRSSRASGCKIAASANLEVRGRRILQFILSQHALIFFFFRDRNCSPNGWVVLTVLNSINSPSGKRM